MKENFDDILKRKWEEKQFPVDPGHRAAMLELLNTKKRRRVVPIWWFGGLMVVSAVAGFYFLNNKDEIGRESPKQELKTSDEKPSQFNELASDATLPNDAKIAADTSMRAAATEIKSSSSRTYPGISSSSVTSTSEENTSLTTNTKAHSADKSHASSSTKEVKKVPDGTSHSNVRRSDVPDVSPKQTDSAKKDYFLVEDEAIRSVIIATEPVGVTILPAGSDMEDETILPSPATRQRLPISDFINPLLIEGIQYASDNAPGEIQAQTSFRNSLYLFSETGVGMIFASRPEYTSGWKLRAGVGLGLTLSPKVHLSWSLGYLMQDGGFDFERTSTVNQPGFGTRSSFNTLTPERLHFAYTRFGMQYRMHRHLLGVHGGIQYLYGAQGTIVIQNQDQFLPETTETSSKTWVNTNGLRKFNWTADISYGYQLTPRLSAIIGTDVYFSPITIPDAALAQEGYTWNGNIAALHPFFTINYLIYGR